MEREGIYVGNKEVTQRYIGAKACLGANKTVI